MVPGHGTKVSFENKFTACPAVSSSDHSLDEAARAVDNAAVPEADWKAGVEAGTLRYTEAKRKAKEQAELEQKRDRQRQAEAKESALEQRIHTHEMKKITSFLCAAAKGDLKVVMHLTDPYQRPVDVDCVGEKGRTALMLTTSFKVARHLLAVDADVNKSSADGCTALGLAQGRELVEIANALKKAGAKQ